MARRAVATRRAGAPVTPLRRIVEALALLAFAVVSLRQFGWLVYERHGALLTLLPSNYGDLPLHWTYAQHMAGGASFWPADPIFTGERLRYPLGVDLLTAVFVQLGAALPILLVVMGLAGALLTALALRRWGGAFAVAGLLFAGGLAGFQILWTGRLVDYQDAVAWKSLYLTLFVPQRGLLLALPAGLLLLGSWRRRLLRGERAPAALGRGDALGRPAARPPAQLPVRLADRGRVGARRRSLARAGALLPLRRGSRDLERVAGDGRLPLRLARRAASRAG